MAGRPWVAPGTRQCKTRNSVALRRPTKPQKKMQINKPTSPGATRLKEKNQTLEKTNCVTRTATNFLNQALSKPIKRDIQRHVQGNSDTASNLLISHN